MWSSHYLVFIGVYKLVVKKNVEAPAAMQWREGGCTCYFFSKQCAIKLILSLIAWLICKSN